MALLVLLARAAAATPDSAAVPPLQVAEAPAIQAAVAAPGATAVLVNVWATWCDACVDELPAVLDFFQAHRAEGLRLIMVSADDEDQRDHVAAFLARFKPAGAALFLKHGDDTAFVNAFDSKWAGALPASFLYDGHGKKQRFWSGAVKRPELEAALRALPTTPTAKPTKGKP